MRRIAWIAGGAMVLLALLAVAAALVVPALIDRPDVRAGIQRRIAAAVGGEVEWQSLEVGLLPVPHGRLLRFRIGIPGKLEATAEQAEVYLRFWPLLLGRTEIASVGLRRPQVRIESAGGSKGGESDLDFMGGYHAVARPLAQALQRFAGETTLEIADAHLEVRRRGSPPFILRELSARAQDDGKGIAVEASAASGLWKALKVRGRIQYAGLSAKAQADVDALDLSAVLALAGDPLKEAGRLDGQVSALASFTIDSTWHAEIELGRSSAAFTAEQFPAAVRIGQGRARVDEEGLRLERIAVSALDAKALVSGTIPFQPFRVQLSTEEGIAGEALLRAVLQRANVPPRLEAKAPLKFSAKRIAWGPGRAAAVEAQLVFDGGPQVGISLGWTPGRLELRRLAIKDAGTEATFAAAAAKGLVQGRFSGVLYGRSLAAMLKNGASLPGSGADRMRGDLRFTLDEARLARSYAEGRLEMDELDLSAFAGGRAVIQHVDLSSGRDALRIGAAKLDWRGQVVELRGEVRRTEQGPRIEATLESPGIVVDRLLPEGSAPKQSEPAREGESKLWPLPVTGHVAVRAAFVEYRGRRVEPVEGSLFVEPRVARIELTRAKLCGASFPMVVEAVPGRFRAAANVDLRDEPVEKIAHCLTDGAVKLTGQANLTARLSTQGAAPELVRNLSGAVQADLKKGRVDEFGLVAKVLALRGNVAGASGQKGIPYRSINAKGRFSGGHFVVDEAFFDSDAARLAASGRIDMLGRDTELTVLVGLLTRVDRVTGAIPIIGDVLGDSITALPVQVKGDIRDPVVVPLGPRAVTGHLLGIFERALKLPGKLVPAPDRKGDAAPDAAPAPASPSSAAPSLPEPSSAGEPSPPQSPR
ncbi:MAG TPA: AsmA-like C-terminal region-containing protein [Burkholderiales bacterium]